MQSFGFPSFDKSFKSNAIPVERLRVSPLLISKYAEEEMQENKETPFKENSCFNQRIESSFFIEASSKDLALVHHARSSLFTNKSNEVLPYASGRLIFINQVMINNKFLKYFPIILDPDEEFIINIIHPFEESFNMKILPVPKSQKVLIDLSLANKSEGFLLHYQMLKQSFSLDEQPIGTMMHPREIFKHFFEKMKYFIHSIQLNYILQRRKTINEHLLLNCQKVIERCNEMAELFLNDFLIQRPAVKEIKEEIIPEAKIALINSSENSFSEEKERIIHCKLCRRQFTNGCALGGHMSRVHPHKSEQYKKKQKIRERRNEHRRAIYESKRKLCLNHHYDYDEAIKKPKGKRDLKKLICQNKKEYSTILRQIKRERGLVN